MSPVRYELEFHIPEDGMAFFIVTAVDTSSLT
jgi:hypothetical protein